MDETEPKDILEMQLHDYSLRLKRYLLCWDEGARGVIVIGVENGHGDMSSNPEWDWLHFT